jgi:cytochrome c-type biogenesis protein CcmH
MLSASVALLTTAYAPQQAGSSPLEPALEARVQKLGKELRCPTCQGLSIADSPAAMARAHLDKVRELVAAGQSDEEIRSYFVARYGEWVLLNPRAEGFNWLVWLAPALLILGGFAVIVRQIRRGAPASRSAAAKPKGNQAPAAEPSSPAIAAPSPADEYLRRVRSELDQ